MFELAIVASASLVTASGPHPGDKLLERASHEPFTIVAFPDTQYYSETAAWTRHFTAQTQWTKDWHAPFGIAFATHLGDIVDNGANAGNLVEWQRADAAIDILDTILPNGAFPYGVCLGNHDFDVVSDKNSGSSVYDQFFGPARYAGRPWYHGASPDRQNHAQVFAAGGRTYLHLTLEWRPDLATFQWAQSVLHAFPGVPTICSTHEHVNDANTSGLNAGRSTAGQTTWLNLIRSNPQIFMFLNGHFASGVPGHNGEHAIVGINTAGSEVLEMLSDYQSWTEGGSGYMRIIRLDERNRQVSVRTFSPSLNQYQTDWNSQFRYAIDFTNRFDGESSSLQTFTFRNGTNGYSGCSDTQISAATPATPAASAPLLRVANTDGVPAGPTAALLRFDGLFGTDAGQIPPGRDVVLAKLRLTVVDSGSGFKLHDMISPWTDAATWSSMVSGVSADGAEAFAGPVAVAGATNAGNLLPLQAIELDVTQSLRAWLSGAPNNGWVLLPFATTNGVDIISASSGDFLGRPQLVVSTGTQPALTRVFQQGVGGYVGNQDTELREASPFTIGGSSFSMFVDSSDPNGSGQDRPGLLKFEGLFGESPAQIPLGARVTSAVLILQVTQEGSGFTLHRIRTSWTESSTWSTLSNGLAVDDSEALRWPEHSAGLNGPAASVKPGPRYIDVTDSVQAWERGEPNEGWLLQPLPAGDDGVQIATSEANTPALRPQLIVRFDHPPACPADVNLDSSVDGDDVIAFFTSWDIGTPAADFNADGAVDGDDVIGFFESWDRGC